MKGPTEKEYEEFITRLSKLNPIEFLGVAVILKVPCFEDLERTKPRKAEDLLSDILDEYLETSHKMRKAIMKQIKRAGRK